MEGTFRLQRQTSRWARFAQVTVRAVAAAESGVRVGPDVAADDQSGRAEACDGAWYALSRLPADARGIVVSVVAIVTAPADTGPGDVKFAAAHAVWAALGRQPAQLPWLGEDGNPVFP
ncbi:hypothetical protein ACFW1A_17010 [Kitasatospora sp. NPDC058965]|uniref:hypothetical protein n=1 Tax=Kitasatospora sp. NPDC058965 TaxID=3346682 RepID=UPI00369C3556